MQAIVHYYDKQVLVKDIKNLSVVDSLGLVIEFNLDKARDYFALKFQKEEIPIQLIGPAQIIPVSTGFTVFEDFVNP